MHSRRRLLLISNSTLHGSGYLEHCSDAIKSFLLRESPQRMNVLFVPWALRDWDNYENTAKKAFEANGFSLRSIHQHADPVQAVEEADAIFIGGGNSFRLLKALYDNNVIEPIRQRVAQGMPYIGTSAGSNVACCSIRTTNDMPIGLSSRLSVCFLSFVFWAFYLLSEMEPLCCSLSLSHICSLSSFF
ncbi:Alpha-aspartyl dipeptidase, variant 2 [Balamuthia mandrillaris]